MEDYHTAIDFWKGTRLIMVDEAQDMNSIDFSIVSPIKEVSKNIAYYFDWWISNRMTF